MATVYNNTAYVVLINKDTGLDTGVYTPNGVVKKWTGATCCQDALDEIREMYGSDEFRIVQDVAFTTTGTITTT